MHIEQRDLFNYDDPETGVMLAVPQRLGTMVPADPAVAQMVIDAKVNEFDAVPDDEGRSPWFWFRLANGDLMLATFPQGDAYLETEADPNRP